MNFCVSGGRGEGVSVGLNDDRQKQDRRICE